MYRYSTAFSGTLGTDHGTGTLALVLGGKVRGGRVVADWPGLAERQLHEARDLKPTLDVGAVATGLLTEHLAISARVLGERVFPGGHDAPLTIMPSGPSHLVLFGRFRAGGRGPAEERQG